MVTYSNYAIPINNARQNAKLYQYGAGSVGTAQTTLISGTNVEDFSKYTFMIHNTHPSAAFTVWVLGANTSGTTAPTINGSTYATITTSSITAAKTTSAAGVIVDTNPRWIAVVGSASAVTSGGLAVDVFMKSA